MESRPNRMTRTGGTRSRLENCVVGAAIVVLAVLAIVFHWSWPLTRAASGALALALATYWVIGLVVRRRRLRTGTPPS